MRAECIKRFSTHWVGECLSSWNATEQSVENLRKTTSSPFESNSSGDWKDIDARIWHS